MTLQQKSERLKRIISRYGSCLIAFSGGTDSTLLLKMATLVLPKAKLAAVTAASAVYPKQEVQFSKKIAREFGIRHTVVRLNQLRDRRFALNSLNRCYICKKKLFLRFKDIARKMGLAYVLEASSLSDKADFRPGNKAKKELGIRSPLIEAGFTKGGIRKLSRQLGLTTWDKPSQSCLVSRIPYGTRLNRQLLARIDEAEGYLKKMGLRQVRLRHYSGLCRIEVLKEDIRLLINKRVQAVNKLKGLGYNYVTIDLEGYRTGSMNIF